MIKLLDVLRALGGVAHRSTVFEYMISEGTARQVDLDVVQTDGGTRFKKHVDFSRKELFDGGLIGDAGAGLWLLTSSGEDTILTHASANQIVALNRALRPLRRVQQKEASRRAKIRRFASGPTTGPKPAAWSGQVSRDNLQPAVTYVLRWGETDVWKVGHTIDIDKRVSQVNKHIPVEVLGISWCLITTRRWENSILAHAMEQEVFRLIDPSRSLGERLRCSGSCLIPAWDEAQTIVARSLSSPNSKSYRRDTFRS
ncbi:MAG TPA: hypothetical protein VF620_08530 [Allosphingosinicella sp.]|jgi:hypothetical protein